MIGHADIHCQLFRLPVPAAVQMISRLAETGKAIILVTFPGDWLIANTGWGQYIYLHHQSDVTSSWRCHGDG
jgi:hypothetical protein